MVYVGRIAGLWGRSVSATTKSVIRISCSKSKVAGGVALCAVGLATLQVAACQSQATSLPPEVVQGAVSVNGQWLQDTTNSESMMPFLAGLGVPRIAAFVVDNVTTTLEIKCVQEVEGGLKLTAVNRTIFGPDTTELTLFAPEVEKLTRGGRKTYMISGVADTCSLTINCRMFQRGDGWNTKQRWEVMEDGKLKEQMILIAPGQEEVVVTRLFNRIGTTDIATVASDDPDANSYHPMTVAVCAAGGLAAACALGYFLRGGGSKSSSDSGK